MGDNNLYLAGAGGRGGATTTVGSTNSRFSAKPHGLSSKEEIAIEQNTDFQYLQKFIAQNRPQDLQQFKDFVSDPSSRSQGDGIDARELTIILREFAHIAREAPTSGAVASVLADPVKRAELIMAAIGDFDDRNGQLRQGVLETCGAASTMVGILASDQARYASFLRRLVGDGNDEQLGFTLPEGTAEVLGRKGMLLSSHLTQIAFMHKATGTYDPITDKSTRSWMASYDHQRVKESGLFSAELQRVLNAYYSDPGRPRATRLIDNFAPDNQDSVRDAITNALHENRTIIFSARGLPTQGVEPGFHYVNVIGSQVELDPRTGKNKTMIVFKDTRGPEYPIELGRTAGGVEVADRARNTYKVEVGEFLTKYANFMLEVKSAEVTQGAYDPDLVTLDRPGSWWEVQNRGRVSEQYGIDTFVPTQFQPLGQKQSKNFDQVRTGSVGAGDEASNEEYFSRLLEEYQQRRIRTNRHRSSGTDSPA